jgi:hypothetical protein
VSILPPPDASPSPERPQPLRPGLTLAGGLVALAFGTLALGSMCAAPRDFVIRIGAGVFWLTLAAIWMAMAGCIYGANQAWIGRDRSERLVVFLQCLGLAFLLFVVALLVVGTASGSLT